jgi:hypothetical protein
MSSKSLFGKGEGYPFCGALAYAEDLSDGSLW